MIRQGGEQIFYENDQNKLTYVCSADNGHFSVTKRNHYKLMQVVSDSDNGTV